jgi:hypothetical protein
MHIMGPLWILLFLIPDLADLARKAVFFQAGRLFAGPFSKLPA